MCNHELAADDAAIKAARVRSRIKAATRRAEAQEGVRRAVVARTGAPRSQEHIAKVRDMQKRHWAKAWDGQDGEEQS